ncbi:MAG: guanylate kinase [Phycisphaerales bacterium]
MPEPTAHHRLATDTDDGMLLVISGPSGVGKTTITRAVERAIPGSVFSVSASTRQKTAADVEGVDYHFVNDAEFDRMVAGGAFLEWAGVFGKKYGTPRAWVDEQLRRGRLVILEIDVQGAKQVKAIIPSAFGLFILPPSEAVLLDRLRRRRRDPEDVIRRRFAEAKWEIDEARASGAYDEFLVNDDLDATIRRAVEVVQGERRRRRGTPA